MQCAFTYKNRCSICLTRHLTCYTLPVVEMLAHSSNLTIHGGIFNSNSAQGDLHIHNRDSESGMHNSRSVQRSILIDYPMKVFTPWGWEFLLERFMTRVNATLRQIVTLIPARPFDRLFYTGFIANVRHLLSSGFTDLLVLVRQRSFRQLQSFCAVYPN